MRSCTALAMALLASAELAAQCSPFEITGVQAADTSVCQGDSVSFNLVGLFADPVSFQWQEAPLGSWVNLADDTLDNITVSPVEDTPYRCLAICEGDTIVSDTVVVTVHDPPLISATADPPGPFCGEAATTLLAAGDADLSWSPPDGLSTTEGPEAPCITDSTITYAVTATDVHGCVTVDSIRIVVLPLPTILVPEDLLVCTSDTEATLLFLFEGAAPFTFTLQTPGGAIDFAGYDTDSLLVGQLMPGGYAITTFSDTGCTVGPGDTAFVQSVEPTTEISAVAVDPVICEGNSTDLIGNDPAPLIGFWSMVPGPLPGQIFPDVGNDSTAVFVPDSTGIYQLRWTITGSSCPDIDTTITVEVVALADPADAGADISACLGPSIALSASDPSPGTGTWSVTSGPGGSFANPADPGTSYVPDGAGTHILRWSVDNGPCLSTPDQVTITVIAPDVPPTIIGLESTACDGTYQTLFIVDSAAVTYTWQCPYWVDGTLLGGLVTAHWDHPGGQPETIPTAITLITGGGCPDTATFAIELSSAPASCPKGIVYFEPHGLAILDPLAAYFQWGLISDGDFVADPARTDQTTFDAAHITGCDPLPYYAVRTSINGSECWSTTLLCATQESLERECPREGLAVDGPQLRAYPNPSDGGPITIEAIGGGDIGLNIALYDVEGRCLSTAQLPATGFTTTLHGADRLQHGVYMLRAWNTGYDRTIKLVIN